MSATEERPTTLDQALQRAERPGESSDPRDEKTVLPSQVVVGLAHTRVKVSPLTAALKRRAESDPDGVARVYFDALGATKRVYLGDQWVDEPDHNVRLKAGDSILNRVDGLPTARTELTGADGGPVTLAALLAVDASDAY